jgi:hypothetical protein
MTRVTSLSTLSLLFIGLSASHDSDREFSGLIQLTQLFFFFFLIDFPLISSFNIVFNWKLGFMICFGLFLIRLFLSHDPIIVLNMLTRVDLTHLLGHFLNYNFL